jgi:HK97 family phage major capsid protein
MKPDRIIELTRLIDARSRELEDIEARRQAESRSLTDEERKRMKELLDDLDLFKEELDLEKRKVGMSGKLNESLRDPVKPGVDSRDDEQIKYPGLPPRELRFEDFGQQLRAMTAATAPGGFVDRRLVRAASGMNESNPSDGGFLVQTDYNAAILQRAFEGSPLLSRVRRIPIGANSNGIKLNAFAETSRVSSILGGIIPYWVGEGYDKTDTMPQFRQIELSLKKLACLWYATDEVLQDATALASVAERGFAEAVEVELERVIMRGTGGGQPLGILTSPALISVTRAQAGSTISATDVIAMYARFRGGSNSAWIASRSIIPQLCAIQLNDNLLYTTPSAGLRENPTGGSLFGYPVLFAENASALGTIGDLTLASLDDYLLATKGGPQMASSIHVKFVSDQTTFRMVVRVDGQPWDNSALTPKDNSNTVGPFVALASA